VASIIIAITSSNWRKALIKLLMSKGHQVQECSSIKELLNEINNARIGMFQVGIIDNELPDEVGSNKINSYSVLKRIKSYKQILTQTQFILFVKKGDINNNNKYLFKNLYTVQKTIGNDLIDKVNKSLKRYYRNKIRNKNVILMIIGIYLVLAIISAIYRGEIIFELVILTLIICLTIICILKTAIFITRKNEK
jgi:DNA-binding NtrC family response regulator